MRAGSGGDGLLVGSVANGDSILRELAFPCPTADAVPSTAAGRQSTANSRVRQVAVIAGMLLLFAGALAISASEPAPASSPSSAANRRLLNSIGMTLVEIPAGQFDMGSADDEPDASDDEKPRHRVSITRPFYLGAYEVTQAEYQQVMGDNPSWFSNSGFGKDRVAGMDTSRHPVHLVSWDDAVEFCRRLSELPAEKKARRSYRLPTEAEWEYACRAGTTTRYAVGESLTSSAANARFGGPKGKTVAVGSYAPNRFGLYDMSGNVWEWCSDWYDPDYYKSSPSSDPAGPPEGHARVVRGGDWHDPVSFCRSANRDQARPARRDVGNGFRVVCIVGQP